MPTDLTASDVVALLEAKHAKDVFVSECKTGSTWEGCSRLDAWAMNRSWANAMTTGYEVKVSRSDFLQDTKWRGYLPYCNAFYFVCPTGLIQPKELPGEAGLMWVSKTGTRLYTKKKAPHRDAVVPEDLYRYVLMSRAVITREHKVDHEQSCLDWLADKKSKKELGYFVSNRIQSVVANVEHENRMLLAKMQTYDKIRATIEAMGLDPESPSDWAVKGRMDEVMGEVPPGLHQSVRGAISRLESLDDILTRHCNAKRLEPQHADF